MRADMECLIKDSKLCAASRISTQRRGDKGRIPHSHKAAQKATFNRLIP